MPKKLDDCIRQVKDKLRKENPALTGDEAESIAWGICKSALKEDIDQPNK